jgi:hypothetical protein
MVSADTKVIRIRVLAETATALDVHRLDELFLYTQLDGLVDIFETSAALAFERANDRGCNEYAARRSKKLRLAGNVIRVRIGIGKPNRGIEAILTRCSDWLFQQASYVVLKRHGLMFSIDKSFLIVNGAGSCTSTDGVPIIASSGPILCCHGPALL